MRPKLCRVTLAKPSGSWVYSYPGVVREFQAAWRRITTHSGTQLSGDGERAAKKRRDRGASRAGLVLDVAKRLYMPGQTPSPTLIALELGLSRQTCQNAVGFLRRSGKWPYAGGQKGSSKRKKSGLR